jgi:hypothetical protein
MNEIWVEHLVSAWFRLGAAFAFGSGTETNGRSSRLRMFVVGIVVVKYSCTSSCVSARILNRLAESTRREGTWAVAGWLVGCGWRVREA